MHRSIATNLTYWEKGEILEQMAVDAIRRYRCSWVLDAERAPSLLDVRGIDILVHIRYPNGSFGRIPLQIKSRLSDVEDYYRKHRKAREQGIVPIILELEDSLVMVALKTYPHLRRMRERVGGHEPYILDRGSWPITDPEGLDLQRKIEWQRGRARPNPKKPFRISLPEKIERRLRLYWLRRK